MKIPALIFCIFIFRFGLCQPEQAHAPVTKIKILSWNIYMLPAIVPSKKKLERATIIGTILSKSDYDVIVFQEAFCKKTRKRLAVLLGDAYPYHAGPANATGFSLKANSGIWILSKYPVVFTDAIIFRNRHGVDALSRKGALLAELNLNGQLIQIAGTHLQNGGEEWIRHSQCVEFYHRLLKPYNREGVPQVICGDFNINRSAEESYTFMLQSLNARDGNLEGNVHYSYDRSGNDLEVEKGTGKDLIDYILLRENGALVSCMRKIRIIRAQWHVRHQDLSDHFSMEAAVTFSNGSGAGVRVAGK